MASGQDQTQERKQRRIYSTKLIDKLISDRNHGYEIDYDPFFNRDLDLRAPNVPFNLTAEELEEYQKCYDDPIYYAEKYAKFMTDHGLTTVNLRPYQKKVISCVTEEIYDEDTDLVKPVNRNIIWNASRQIGKCGLFSDFLQVSSKNDLTRSEQIRFLDLVNKYKNKRSILSRIKTFLCKIYCQI